jgi:hypothetical protein
MPEYLDSQVADEHGQQVLQRLFSALAANTGFDPNSQFRISSQPDHTTNWLYHERKIPVATMEQRIGPSKKLGRQPTVEDRLEFGLHLMEAMAESVTR